MRGEKGRIGAVFFFSSFCCQHMADEIKEAVRDMDGGISERTHSTCTATDNNADRVRVVRNRKSTIDCKLYLLE